MRRLLPLLVGLLALGGAVGCSTDAQPLLPETEISGLNNAARTVGVFCQNRQRTPALKNAIDLMLETERKRPDGEFEVGQSAQRITTANFIRGQAARLRDCGATQDAERILQGLKQK